MSNCGSIEVILGENSSLRIGASFNEYLCSRFAEPHTGQRYQQSTLIKGKRRGLFLAVFSLLFQKLGDIVRILYF
jgi:hypothetical protein